MKKIIITSLGVLLLLVSGCKPIGALVSDVTAPIGSININGGAPYTNISMVTINLSSSDSTEMYITNTPGCGSDGIWEPFSNTKSWTLGQINATATVYARFKDRSQNISDCQSDTIGHYSNSWIPISTSSAPAARQWESVVWTGEKMIVWGGYGFFGASSETNNGDQYDPASDSWTMTSTGADVPSARSQHSTVWTGTEMIVWGGSGFLNDGGRYTPNSDTWTRPTISNAPAGRYGQTAIWTGSKMIIWGGQTAGGIVKTGGIYDPSTDSWTPTLADGTAPSSRANHFAFWTGDKMLIWGGAGNNTGGLYNPSNDTWTTMSTTNAPTATYGTTAIWTGTKMIVWGGQTGPGFDVQTGAVYDPTSDTWTVIGIGGNTPSARGYHSAIWTGTKMIVWGGKSGYGSPDPVTYPNVGGIYDLATDSWTQLSNLDYERAEHKALWTGWGMIVWGGRDSGGSLNTGAIYFP